MPTREQKTRNSGIRRIRKVIEKYRDGTAMTNEDAVNNILADLMNYCKEADINFVNAVGVAEQFTAEEID